MGQRSGFGIALKAVIWQDGKFLILKRTKIRQSEGDLWEFPGGGLEIGEQHESALVREIKEEVWNGGLKGVTFEGVVMKGPKILHHPVMVKAKSKAWISRLKDKCRGDEELFKQLV